MNKRLLILLGPPCSGKGTQAKLLQQKFKGYHLSAGDLLRSYLDKDGETRKFLDAGGLVDPALVNNLIFEKIKEVEDELVIIDGYPRTLEQAKFISNLLTEYNLSNHIFLIKVSKELLLDRMRKRKFCVLCQSTYKNPIHCCGEMTIERNDDKEHIFEKRYDGFLENLDYVLDNIKNYVVINGENSEDEVLNQIIYNISTT